MSQEEAKKKIVKKDHKAVTNPDIESKVKVTQIVQV
jgi:hypothetical protein